MIKPLSDGKGAGLMAGHGLRAFQGLQRLENEPHLARCNFAEKDENPRAGSKTATLQRVVSAAITYSVTCPAKTQAKGSAGGSYLTSTASLSPEVEPSSPSAEEEAETWFQCPRSSRW